MESCEFSQESSLVMMEMASQERSVNMEIQESSASSQDSSVDMLSQYSTKF